MHLQKSFLMRTFSRLPGGKFFSFLFSSGRRDRLSCFEEVCKFWRRSWGWIGAPQLFYWSREEHFFLSPLKNREGKERRLGASRRGVEEGLLDTRVLKSLSFACKKWRNDYKVMMGAF